MILAISVYIAAICFVPVLLKAASGKLNLFDPLVSATLALVSLFSIRPMAMLATGDTEFYRQIYIGDTIGIALMISAAGVTAYVLGYMAPLKFPRFLHWHGYTIGSYSRSRLYLICFIYAAVGLLLAFVYLGPDPLNTLAFLSRGRSASFNDVITLHTEYLFSAPIFISCAAILYVMFVVSGRPSLWNIVFLVFLISLPVAWFYLMGVRRFIIPTIFIPLIAFFLARQKRPKLGFVVIVMPLFLIIAALPFMRTEGARSEIGGLANQVKYAFSRQDIFRDIFLGPDTEMLPALAVKVQALDSPEKFYYGRAIFGDLLMAPIPSALIAKPMSARDKALMDTFGEPCSALPGGICPDFSIIGTFYKDFWLPGVIIGMALLGWLCRQVWRGYLCDSANPILIFNSAAIFVFVLIIIRAGFMPAFQWFLYFWIPVMIGIVFVSRRAESQA